MMKHGKKIFLTRHGRSIWNGRKIISGQLNPPLSNEGLIQAQCLAEVLRGEKLAEIHTSSLSRTIETARPTAEIHGLRVIEQDDLREINFGILQGRFRDERDAESQKMWAERELHKEHFRVPNGETFAELEKRIDAWLTNILATDEPILIVGHRSANRMILRRLMNWSRQTAVSLKLRSKYLYEINFAENASEINTIQICGGAKFRGFKE
jgi:broad specificity phosphatase PhoE